MRASLVVNCQLALMAAALAGAAKREYGAPAGPVANFSDRCASCVRGRHGPTFGYWIWISNGRISIYDCPIQVRKSATGSQIVREKTLRQAPLSCSGLSSTVPTTCRSTSSPEFSGAGGTALDLALGLTGLVGGVCSEALP